VVCFPLWDLVDFLDPSFSIGSPILDCGKMKVLTKKECEKKIENMEGQKMNKIAKILVGMLLMIMAIMPASIATEPVQEVQVGKPTYTIGETAGYHIYVQSITGTKANWKVCWTGDSQGKDYFYGRIYNTDGYMRNFGKDKFEGFDYARKNFFGDAIRLFTRIAGHEDCVRFRTDRSDVIRFNVKSTMDSTPIYVGPNSTPVARGPNGRILLTSA